MPASLQTRIEPGAFVLARGESGGCQAAIGRLVGAGGGWQGKWASSLLKHLACLLICISSDICEDILIRYLHQTFNSNFVGLVTLGRYEWIFMIKYLIGNILNIFKYLKKNHWISLQRYLSLVPVLS